jgi:N-acetylglucosamine malate deacetylase 2
MPSRKWLDGSERVVAEIQRAAEERSRASLRLLVLAAHPDDETLGASALLGRCATCAVAFLTDGATRDPNFRPGWTGTTEAYAAGRRQEAVAALAIAQIPPESLFWLGATDQECVGELDRAIPRFANVLGAFAADAVVTHAYEGGHPDHDTAALLAMIALSSLGARQRTELFEMACYHARDGQRITGEFLPAPSGDSAGGFVTRLTLTEEERNRKARMLACYATQQEVLRGFPMEPERLRPAPQYDFSQPPHTGALWYECLGWPMTGERWRASAATLLARL